MAKITFVEGVKCTKCGNLIAEPTIFTSQLCQNCGARIMTINVAGRSYEATYAGKSVTLKVTHKLFGDIIEEVE